MEEMHQMGHIKGLEIIKLAVSIGVCLAAGFIGSIFTSPSIPTWYETLEKPSLNPPNWLFAPVWTILYVLMGISAFLVWRVGLSRSNVKIALVIFIIQIIFNVFWNWRWKPIAVVTLASVILFVAYRT